jgi:polyadenylate-binding protein
LVFVLKRIFSRLFVKNLPEDFNSKELCDIFQPYGNITSIKLKQGLKGECLGQGYIQFSNEQESELAIEKLNNMIIKGRQIVIEKFNEKSKRKSNEEDRTTIIYVQQMPISV